MSHINEEQWTEMLDLLEEDFVDLIQEYLKDSQVRIQKIKHAQQTGDNTTGLNESHTLKGASASIGANALSQHCFTMQAVCQKKMIDNAYNVVESIETEFANVANEINHRLAQLG